jgi:hypothetical protein
MRAQTIEKHTFGDNYGGVRQLGARRIRPPSHNAPPNPAQAVKQTGLLKNIPEKRLRRFAYHDHRKSGAISRLCDNMNAGATQQMSAGEGGYALTPNTGDVHPGTQFEPYSFLPDLGSLRR